MKNLFMTCAFLTCMAASALQACGTTQQTPQVGDADYQRPNVLVILVDDLGAADLSYLGCTDFQTPHIDALAASGVTLTDGHVCATVCAPSRAGLITGRYQQRFGAESNGHAHDGRNVPGEAVTIAEALSAEGYVTYGLGKWHLGHVEECFPMAQGFDHFSGFLAGGRDYFEMNNPSHTHMLRRNGQQVPEADIGYLTDWLSDEASSMIEQRDADKPFFMYLAYNAPHTPMHATKEDLALFPHLKGGRKKYAAMMHALDRGVANVMATLEAEGIADDTLVIFLSDNGGATTNSSDNGIWRGMKGSVWEGGMRVPFIVRWPNGGLSGGGTCGHLTSSLDIMATALALAGAEDKIEALDLDGVNAIGAWRAEANANAHDAIYWRRGSAAAVRQGDWKLWRVSELDGTFRYGLVNLADDPSETTDLTSVHPQRVEAMAQLIFEWEAGLQEARWREGKYWEQNQRLKHDFAVIGRDAERRLP